MSCDPGYFSQATIRSEHTGGAFVAMADGSVVFISNDIETTGATIGSPCCTAWDYMLASADNGQPGALTVLRPYHRDATDQKHELSKVLVELPYFATIING